MKRKQRKKLEIEETARRKKAEKKKTEKIEEEEEEKTHSVRLLNGITKGINGYTITDQQCERTLSEKKRENGFLERERSEERENSDLRKKPCEFHRRRKRNEGEETKEIILNFLY